jgi:phosphoglycolate phosphatase-like HAD superfamily hydrolase
MTEDTRTAQAWQEWAEAYRENEAEKARLREVERRAFRDLDRALTQPSAETIAQAARSTAAHLDARIVRAFRGEDASA